MIVIPAFVAALFRREEWQAVGFMDYSWTESTKVLDARRKKVRDIKGRAVFLVSNKGRRKVETPHRHIFRIGMHMQDVGQMIAWEKGGPLPDDFKPHQGPERKPWKVPEAIRGQFNKEK